MRGEVRKRVDIDGLPEFWERLSTVSHRFLALDYDGTLAPFHVDRMKALPYPGMVEKLRTLGERSSTTLAIVSGRPVREVLELLGPVGMTVVGGHGFELRRPDGSFVVTPPLPAQKNGLETALTVAHRLTVEDRLERKIASVALHTRGLPPHESARLEGNLFELWSGVARAHGLECRPFNGGVEIRAVGRHKGTALGELLAEQPRGTVAVYVGDDDTDEDAFRVVRERGFALKVGVPSQETAAQGFLRDIPSVAVFLEDWLSMD